MINKKNDLLFRAESILLVLDKNGIPINEASRSENYKINGTNNSFELVFNKNVGNNLFSVFGSFDKVVSGIGNQYSGKHNFYSNSELNEAIKEFEKFLIEVVKKLD